MLFLMFSNIYKSHCRVAIQFQDKMAAVNFITASTVLNLLYLYKTLQHKVYIYIFRVKMPTENRTLETGFFKNVITIYAIIQQVENILGCFFFQLWALLALWTFWKKHKNNLSILKYNQYKKNNTCITGEL